MASSSSSSEAKAARDEGCEDEEEWDEPLEEGEELCFNVPYSLMECCIVSGLSKSTKIEELDNLFSPYGHIVESEIINNRETGEPTGFGYVSFANDKSFYDALEALNGHNLGGHTITVTISRIRKYVENYGRSVSEAATKTKT